MKQLNIYPPIQELIKPYFKFNFEVLCDALYNRCKTSMDNLDKKVFNGEALVATHLFKCLCNTFVGDECICKMSPKGRNVEFIFNPFVHGANMLQLISDMLNGRKFCKEFRKQFSMYLDIKDKTSIPGLKELNEQIQKEYGINILELYYKRLKLKEERRQS